MPMIILMCSLYHAFQLGNTFLLRENYSHLVYRHRL